MWDNWVLDASMGRDGDPLCFCPIEDDGSIVVGMNYMGAYPPGNLVGIVHQDGQQAVDEWCERNSQVLTGLQAEHEARLSAAKDQEPA